MNAKELREKRAKVYKAMRELADKISTENRAFTAEEDVQWKSINDDYNELTRRIEVAERAASIEEEQSRSVNDSRDLPGRDDSEGRSNDDQGRSGGDAIPDDEARALSLQAWCRTQMGEDLDERQEEACRQVGMNPNHQSLRLDLGSTSDARQLRNNFRSHHPDLALRALSVVSGGSGAYTVPDGFIGSLETNMLAFGGMLQVADVMRTASGEPLPWPTADDTGNEGEQIGENTEVGTADPTFGQVVWNAYKLSSKMILVPVELLEDSAFDLANWLGGAIGERLGRVTNRKATVGTGAGTFKGLMVASSLGVTAASATAMVAEELIALEHSVDPAYRINTAGYMMHDNILLETRKLKDSDGRFYFQSNMREGGPDTINGRPFTINQHMDSTMAAGKKTIAFGQLDKYKIRQVRQIRLRRLIERYAEKDQEGFVAFVRSDGNLLDAGTAPVKYLEH